MSHAGIQSGTAGWRGIIGEDFTFARVRSAAAAIARLAGARRKHPTFLVSYDARFLSEEFAQAAATAIESAGAHALLTSRATPIPAASFEILRSKLAGGLYIGAGCEPADCNGLTFLQADGSPASPESGDEIVAAAGKPIEDECISSEAESRDMETVDTAEPYLQRLGELVRLDAIRRAGVSIVFDSMHGAAAGWLDRVLVAGGVPVLVLNQDRDVLFDGRAPDPSPENLERLREIVRETGAALGVATDGDGRRCGIFDGKGRYVAPSHIRGLLNEYLRESRGWKPSASQDGGVTIRGHVPVSDGILACLLAAEMVAKRGPLDIQLQKWLRRAGEG